MRAQQPRSPVLSPSTLLSLAAFAALAVHFAFLCDDAYISFRYARHLAEGEGLVFNLGGERVEGYSNFLWVLVLGLGESLGLASPTLALALSSLCGLGLFLSVRAHLTREGSRAAVAGSVIFATLPPLAVWTTGGLATMPFALALFELYRRVVAPPAEGLGPRGVAAAVGAVLLRADGFVWIGLVGGLSLARGFRERSPALTRRAARALTITALVFGAHTLLRLGYYGDWLPNTARAKVSWSELPPELRDDYLRRGFSYGVHFLLTFPSVALALVLCGVARRAFVPAGVVLGALAYAVATGGDFMAMGRLIVPALPFACVAFASAAARFSPVATGVLTASAAVATLLPAFDRHVVPEAWRRAFHFRWNTDQMLSEREKWEDMRDNTAYLLDLGRALAQHTGETERGIFGPIGAVGYTTRHWILDTYGLTNRRVLELPITRMSLASPGHDRAVPQSVVLQWQPELRLTYFEARLEPTATPLRQIPANAPVFEEAFPAEPDADGTERRLVLVRPR